ncbi:MAG: Hg(II)-responsive transcriptional regulator [Candidimonas sp.]|nr:MAG: Hg(II)-responsive transcriptional regulator [Candidimonas sp.]
MDREPVNLTIGTFAKAAGVNVETIRFYQRKGLLSTPTRPTGGIRHYGDADVARVKFVKSSKRLGFNLGEIAQLLRLEDGAHCGEAAELAAERLNDVRVRLADLVRIEAALSQLIEDCRAANGNVSCPLIAALRHSYRTT